MAQSTAALTYNQVGEREDLTNIVTNITRDETPLFSRLGKVKATGLYHEYQTDTLAATSTGGAIEGADFSFAIPTARTRLGNYTQIFTKSFEVSDTLRAVTVAGVEDEYRYQVEKAMKEIARNIEATLINSTSASGASGTARTLQGVLAAITTNVTTGTGTGNEALTEDMFNDTLQIIWAAGGKPNMALVNAFQKRQISSFATSNTRYYEVGESKKLVNSVSVYESDFGTIEVVLDHLMPAGSVAILTEDHWKVAILRGITQVDVAKVGDATRGALVGELTLEARNEAGSGEINQLTTS